MIWYWISHKNIFSIGNEIRRNEIRRNEIIFGADVSSSLHINKKKKDM